MTSFLKIFFQSCWIGLCALAMLLQTTLLLPHGRPSFGLMAFVFGATVFAYNFAAPGVRGRAAWGMGLLSVGCFPLLSGAQQWSVALPAVVWVLYYRARRPGPAILHRYPALKPAAIALVWAWVTVLLALPPGKWPDTLVMFLGRTAFIFALALAYDYCDQDYDRRLGFVTLVMLLGPRIAFRLMDAALLLSAACVLVNYSLGKYAVPAALALLLSLALGRLLIRQIVIRHAWGDWRRAAIDGVMVLQCGLVWGAAFLKANSN